MKGSVFVPNLIDSIYMTDVLGVKRLVIDTSGRFYPSAPGTQFYVNSVTGSDSNDGLTMATALATIDAAINKCTANVGDVIWVAPAHVEVLATASAITVDVAGISIVGMGIGNDRPKITIGTLATATIVISAASVMFSNIILISALDGLDNALVVTGDDCIIDIEFRDTSSTVEANIAIQATGVDRGTFKIKYIGFIAGNAVTNAIVMTNCTSCDVDVDFYGVAATSIVEFLGTACHNINVVGYFYNSGTSDLSKNVVDTVTGSTWTVQGFDGVAGCLFSGGSGAALAKEDLSVVAANIVLVKTETDKIPAEVVKTLAIQNQTYRTCVKKTAATPVTQNLFTITGGAVRILGIVGHITTACAAGANNTKLVHTSTGGSAVDLCATLDTASAAIRLMLGITGIAANAMIKSAAEGVQVAAEGMVNPITITPGVISLNCSAGTTGVIDWFIEYEPMASGATIVPA
jgi:hypothetical protein